MELGQKIQELRKNRGLTQEELAAALFVSRTAISKWESGRGYPNIDSLKAIAAFFSVTVDALLSADEMLVLAESAQKSTARQFRDLAFGLADLAAVLLLFLPLFADRSGAGVQAVSLLSLGMDTHPSNVYLLLVIATALTGACTLILHNREVRSWQKIKTELSLACSTLSVLDFILGLHPYAAAFAFALLAMKVILLLRRA